MFGVKRCSAYVFLSVRRALTWWLCAAKILSQLKNADSPVPIEFFVQAKAKEPPTDALPRFVQAYTAHDRVATLMKEPHSGKLIDEWNKAVGEAEKKPTLLDMSAAVASFLAVKDEEELVSVTSFKYGPPPIAYVLFPLLEPVNDAFVNPNAGGRLLEGMSVTRTHFHYSPSLCSVWGYQSGL